MIDRSPTAPKPPVGLKKAGRSLWAELMEHLELDRHEEALLIEAARCVDRLDALDRVIRRNGAVLPDGRASAALVEARMQQLTLARLVAALRLPTDLQDVAARPQRRAVRGVYLKAVQ